MSDLQARRKALAAEAEVYRQTIKLELQNIKLYTRQSKQKFTSIRPSNPLFIAAAPLLTALLRRSRPVKKLRMVSSILMAWQLVNRFAPLLPGIIAAIRYRRDSRKEFRREQSTPAAAI